MSQILVASRRAVPNVRVYNRERVDAMFSVTSQKKIKIRTLCVLVCVMKYSVIDRITEMLLFFLLYANLSMVSRVRLRPTSYSLPEDESMINRTLSLALAVNRKGRVQLNLLEAWNSLPNFTSEFPFTR